MAERAACDEVTGVAMTPLEMVDFYLEEAEGWREGASEASARGDIHHFLVSTTEVFKCNAMVGLIKWRHDLGNPKEHIAAAVAVAEALVADELAGTTDLVWRAFPLSCVPYLAHLVDRESGEIVKRLPSPEITARRPEAFEPYLDTMLLQAFHGTGSPPDSWLETAPRKVPLVIDTYRCYHDLLIAAPEARAALVHKAEDLYRRRGRNSYYSGGTQLFGGGPGNDHVVDFILGAILKRIGASRLSKVHGWRW